MRVGGPKPHITGRTFLAFGNYIGNPAASYLTYPGTGSRRLDIMDHGDPVRFSAASD